MSISVLILTKNEETNLPRCLEALSWSDDIVVLDDGSTDATRALAREAGARVIEHSAGSERLQRDFATREISFDHPWVYNPDADEVPTEELVAEMRRVVDDPSRPYVAYRARFKTIFMDRWIRHSSLYPTWVVRLFRPGALRYEREFNHPHSLKGPIGYLQEHFVHHAFSKGLDDWIAKHNRYSSIEAQENLESMRRRWAWPGLLSRDAVERRSALKDLSLRLPFRPSLRFLYMYVLRGGFLDGYPGLVYCRLLAMYEYLIVLKLQALRSKTKKPA